MALSFIFYAAKFLLHLYAIIKVVSSIYSYWCLLITQISTSLLMIQGQTDIELNEVGRKQAVRVAERLSREPNISAIYSSDLKRALKTAEAIASRCGLEVVTDKDLRERHVGDLQGLAFSKSPKGGGESRDQLNNRYKSSLQRIAEKHRGARVVVVTHYTVIKNMYKLAIPGESVSGIRNASISIFQFSEGDQWSIKLWNDQSHLKELGYYPDGGDASS
ncbi:phosphoglycerate mutase-like protein 4 isoform X2 [Chenopodium quinoa]|uniref:phosphoglycerate mutase-like protein 4 isoform X2 n=1 Tax=Chenopodium quinoa TaxID=63459 RepID=UPI000B795FE4|nr:phosphoglycerate mutase-like protein 4 isoform X2 [Chenopodium quinoa]